MNKIRKAVKADALGIHNAHMLSIQTICSKDHSNEEIASWGGRSFNEAKWHRAIENQHVWVVLQNDVIEGYAHLSNDGYIEGLYLTEKCIGKKIGYRLMKMMMKEAKKTVQKMQLHSSITAHDFYLKMGFTDNGPIETVTIAGYPIRCYSMTMSLV